MRISHAGTRAVSRPLFRRGSLGCLLQPLYRGRNSPGCGVPIHRDGPQGLPVVRSRAVRRRRERHRRFQVLERSAAHLVVRSSSERLPERRGCRALPPRHQRPEAVRSGLQILHHVHQHGGLRQVGLSRAGSRRPGEMVAASSTARSIPTPGRRSNWARRP